MERQSRNEMECSGNRREAQEITRVKKKENFKCILFRDLKKFRDNFKCEIYLDNKCPFFSSRIVIFFSTTPVILRPQQPPGQ